MLFRSIHSRPRALVLVLVAALAAQVVAPAAQAGKSEEARQARAHYRSGEEAFRAGRFEEAYQEWQQGYKLSGRPLFLLNMAHAQRRRGDLKNARTLYQRFLLMEPQSKLRGEIEGVLAEIDQTLAAEPSGLDRGIEPAATEPPPAAPVPPPAVAPEPVLAPPIAPPPVPPPVPPLAEAPLARPAPPPLLIASAPPPTPAPGRPIYKRWWFWTGTGALIAAGLAGVFLLRSDPYAKNGSIGTIGAPP
jgi:hypothetical protein